MTTPDELSLAAQDHYLHGHALTPWITDYVDLEESLAIGSMAQDELAHAAALLAAAGWTTEGRDELVYERSLEDWAPAVLAARRFDDFVLTVVRGLVLSTAAVVRAESWLAAGDVGLRSTAAVLVAEQDLHVAHWLRWTRRLSQDLRTADDLVAKGRAVLLAAGDVFGPAPSAPSGQAELHVAWRARLARLLAGTVLSADPLGEAPVPRTQGHLQPDLVHAMTIIRSLRTGADDGVRGIYR